MTRATLPALQLRIRGPAVGAGRIPVPELLKICSEAQTAVKRQAEAMEGRNTPHPGPVAAVIVYECTLELVGVKSGSTVLEFGFAKPQLPLAGMEPHALGALAIAEIGASIRSLEKGNKREIDPAVLKSLYELGGILETKRVTSIGWIATGCGGNRKRVVGEITPLVRERAALRLSSPRFTRRHVDGVLDMADFRPQDHKCRIGPAIGPAVTCTFPVELADQVQQLLRQTVRACGEARLAHSSDRIETLAIEQLAPIPSLTSGDENFVQDSSLSRLAEVQGVKRLTSVRRLSGAIPGDADVDSFLEDIYEARA